MRPLPVLASLALLTTPAFAAISWNISYNDVINNTGIGFDDPTHGATRRSTFESVTNYISSRVDGIGTVDFEINNSLTNGTDSLASAGTYYFGGPNGFSNGLLFQHATTGTDPTGSVPDGIATFDFGYNWNSGTTLPTATQIDLYSVSLHELTHALGFSSLLESNGTSSISGGNPGVFSVFDSYLERGDGTPLFSTVGGATYVGTAGDLISDDLYFAGPNAVAANGGNPIQIYAPSPIEPGSSISHIKDTIDAVMNPSISYGTSKREFSEADTAILRDLGWTVVPEPSSLTLLLLGGLFFTRRKR